MSPGESSDDPESDGDGDGSGEAVDWPVTLRGVTESVVATLGPNDRWNVAALGLRAPAGEGAVTGRTWGNTRTRRNFERREGGVVQFTTDPREFVDAALDVREEPDPVLPGAAAWVEVDVERVDAGEEADTEWVEWRLDPVEAAVRERTVPTINRGFAAVVDATVAASRLEVDAYDTATLLDRLRYFGEVVEACGGPAEREAFARIEELSGWRERARNESF